MLERRGGKRKPSFDFSVHSTIRSFYYYHYYSYYHHYHYHSSLPNYYNPPTS